MVDSIDKIIVIHYLW